MAKLSHVDGEGKARMVDIGAKAVTRREAAASSFIKLGAATLRLVRANRIAKGDVLNPAPPAGAPAALTVYDMVKAVERGAEIVRLRLDFKRGGKSGVFRRRS